MIDATKTRIALLGMVLALAGTLFGWGMTWGVLRAQQQQAQVERDQMKQELDKHDEALQAVKDIREAQQRAEAFSMWVFCKEVERRPESQCRREFSERMRVLLPDSVADTTQPRRPDTGGTP